MAKRMTSVLVAVVLSAAMIAAAAPAVLRQFGFDETNSLDRWYKMVLKGQVDYELVRQGGLGYVQAMSDKACSALYYKMPYNLKDYPVLSWRWKAVKFPDISKARTPKDRDDYAARVYVIFPYLSFSISKFVEYVWSEDMPEGTVFDSPYGSNVKIFVVRSGRAMAGEWASESRNVYDDYIKAFGKEPDKEVGAIAIMCDADSTKTSAESHFDDITVCALEGAKAP